MATQGMITEAQQAVSKAKHAFDAKIAEIEAREVKTPTTDDMGVLNGLTDELGSSVSRVKSLQASFAASAEAKAAEERWSLQPADRADAGHEHAAKGMRISCGEIFTGHADYKSFIEANANTNNASPVSSRSVGVKSIVRKAPVTGLSSTQAGALIVNDRFAEITDLAQYGPRPLRTLFRQLQTTSDTVDYARVVTKTNNAAPTLEATATAGSSGAAPESALTLELVSTIVEEISHYVPTTKRALADASQISGVIDQFLSDGLAEVIESQLINGNGTSPNLRGLLNTVGIQTHVIGATLDLDEVLAMLTKVRITGRRSPNFISINEADWWTADLAQKKDTQGRYMLLDPSKSVDVASLWGLYPAVSDKNPAGSPIVGDARCAAIWDRQMADISIGQPADFFIRKLFAVMGTERLAFGVLDPQGFCVGTVS